MSEMFRFRSLDSQSANRKWDVLGEGESIFEGAFNLGKERGRQASQPLDQATFIDGFDLFGYDLGCKGETSSPFGYDRVTWREMRRVLGQRNDNHELAELIDTIIGENDHRPVFLISTPMVGSRLATTTSPRFTPTTGFLRLQDLPGLLVAQFPLA